jgi:hypothetical protein
VTDLFILNYTWDEILTHYVEMEINASGTLALILDIANVVTRAYKQITMMENKA